MPTRRRRARTTNTRGRFSRGRVWLSALVAGLVAVLGVPLTALPASAAEDYLSVVKIVDNPTPQPGETFTYTMTVKCSEADCLNAAFSDPLPAGLAGFDLVDVTFAPDATTVPRTVTWGPGGTSDPPDQIGTDTTLDVDFQQPTANPVGTGLTAGTTFTIQMTLRVPDNYPPGQSPDIVNTATATADNANTKNASATINVDAPVVIDNEVTKSWGPTPQDYQPGSASTIDLSNTNTSNVPVDTMTLQEPKAAADGAATLDPSNPFTITDFTGFGDVSLPDGCDQVQVDAYVYNGSTWNWEEGDPVATPTTLALPDGVDEGDVGGIRITCTGEMARNAEIDADLDLAQRSTQRDTGADLSTDTHSVDNTATGSVTKEGQDPSSDDGDASYVVNPVIPTVTTSKNIEPTDITAGQSSKATISGTNGDVPVSSMTMSDTGMFNEEVTFGGFDGPLDWPQGATSASITYYLLPDDTPETYPFGENETPPDPSGDISGFEITWTGTIQPNQTASASYAIDTTEDATGGDPTTTVTNDLDTTVTAANGKTADDSTSADLRITNPDISVTLDKSILPSSPVEPGDTVTSSLKSTAVATGDGASVSTITVEDAWDGSCDGFWNAFDVTSIAPTQVPANTRMTIEVQGPDGTWTQVVAYGPEASATVFQLSESQWAAAVAPLDPSDVQGIRFTFTDADGFPASQIVTPNVVYTARSASDLRDSSCPTPPEDTPVTYTNAATTDADGRSDGGKNLHDDDDDQADATVIYPSGGGTGPGIDIEKNWTKDFVSAQSSERAGTTLSWSVDDGLSPVTITDTANSDPTAVADTVFDAFDLISLEAVPASDTPFTSGWYFKYDTVTKVELYDATNGWTTVPAPGGSWMTGDRGFKGYALSGAEQASTLGIRITVEETAADTAARNAAQSPGGAFDPYAPAPNSGVGSGSSDRDFDLTWQVRDKTRSDGSFVVQDKDYNTDDPGLVNNSVELAGTPTDGGATQTDRDSDNIQIVDPDPGVAIDKSVSPTSDIFTPPVGTPAADYPTATWSLTAHNTSTARASYVRVTDPAACDDTSLGSCQTEADPASAVADPFDTSFDYLGNPDAPNPFDRFDLTKLTIAASIPGQVDLDATSVWLLHYNGGTYTTSLTNATGANALSAADLADVVGFSVTYQDTDPATTGGTITQDNNLTITADSRLRPTVRSTGEDQVLKAGQTLDVTNRSVAQSYDPVTSPDVKTGDIDDATTVLTGGVVDVVPTKTVTPDTITQPEHDAGNDTVTVDLGANQGSSTLAPQQVVLEDQSKSADFWNTFDFTGLGDVTFPDGADQVQVDLYDGSSWVTGTPGPTATLPDVPNADVQGIRFTFSRSDGGLFSNTLPAQPWSTHAKYTVKLRDDYRDSGDPVEFPSTVTNTQTSSTTRTDGNDSDLEDATADIDLTPGTHEISVNKLTNGGNRLAAVGDNVPFDLTIKNTGTGYLTLTQLRDVLPPELLYTGDPEPEFTADPDGTLSEDVTVTPNDDGSELTFTWPEDGNQMLPGETFKIRLYLQLQPGLATGETATNTMTVQTDEELTNCRNTEEGGSTTDDFENDDHTCGTSDYVGVVTGPNLFTVKGVRGSLPGAYQPTNPDGTCNQNLQATGGSYYRSPCVANSQLDGTDDWVLHAENVGTVNVDEMTFFDQLPVDGDALLISGSSRQSNYRPQIVPGSLKVTGREDVTPTIEVTTSPNVCEGTWSDLGNQPPCEQSGETWTTAGPDTDWSKVSGLRIRLDFVGSTGGTLKSGESVDVTFSTTNEPQTDADPSGASTTVPASKEFAINQFGMKYRYTGVDQFSKIAPSQVGVHLRYGSIQVVKKVTGPAAKYAPDVFPVDVSCSAGGVPLDLGDDSTLELRKKDDYTARIDGIPLSADGTTCTVDEQGDTGDFGETTRDGTPTTLDVTEPTDPAQPADEQDVPEAQIATITNDYQYTGLSVQKKVDTQAVDPTLGPFRFTLSCKTATGEDVTFDDDGTTVLKFTLQDGQTFTAPEDTIPVGSTCTIAETDSYFAGNIVITGDNVVDNGDGTATVKPGPDPVEIVVTNAYDAGTVTLEKVVDGDGADLYGAGPFDFDVSCRFHLRKVYDGTVELGPGETSTLGPYPVGTRCLVKETKTAGADDSVLDPRTGIVVVPEPDEDGGISNVSLTATNTFDLTSLDVRKVVTGDPTKAQAAGPFTTSLKCTRLVDGEREPVEIPDGADRELSPANGFKASYDDLPASSVCTLTETDDGDADATLMKVDVNGTVKQTNGDKVTIDLSDTDGPGHAAVTVVNRFDSGDVSPDNTSGGGGGGSGSGLPNSGAPFGPWLVGVGLLLLLAGATTAAAAHERRTQRGAPAPADGG